MMTENPASVSSPPSSRRRLIGPVALLLFLSPAVGELLSGSSPPMHFFNPFMLLLLVALYGCGAVLVREVAFRYRLNLVGLLLLGCAYGIIEEGLTCKSFFNPHWGDLGILNAYGRAGGVNWLWSLGLTYYHATVSIMAPIFLVQALFRQEAGSPWLKRRGWIANSVCFSLIVVVGFFFMDSPHFDLSEIQGPAALAVRLKSSEDPLSLYLHRQFSPGAKQLLAKYDAAVPPSKPLQKAMIGELNRLLADPGLYEEGRFRGVPLTEETRRWIQRKPRNDDLVRLNRMLLEAAFPREIEKRAQYPYRPSFGLTLVTFLTIFGLVALALRQRQTEAPAAGRFRPYRSGLLFALGFVAFGFILPGMVEGGAKIPALLNALLWVGLFGLLARSLRLLEASGNTLFSQAYWAMGTLTLWAVLGFLQENNPSTIENFTGMMFVGLGFAIWMVLLKRRWRQMLISEEGVLHPVLPE